MIVLVTCKNEEDPIIYKGARVVTRLFINSSKAQGQLWLSLLPVRSKKVHPKMKALEWSQHFSHYKSMGIFSNAQGQLTPQSLVRSCRISNPFQISMFALITCKSKEEPIKNEDTIVVTRFSHYNPMGAIFCHGNQISDPIWPKT